jgi:S1-C subfamily serine protease
MTDTTGADEPPRREEHDAPRGRPWWLESAEERQPATGPHHGTPLGPHIYEASPAPEEPPPVERPRRPLLTILAVALASALVGGAVVGGAVIMFWKDDPVTAPPVTVVQRVETQVTESPTPDGGTVSAAEVARRVLPSIVMVERGRLDEEEAFTTTGGGSGVFLDTDGHVVTNHHVVDGAEVVRVILTDGRIFPATVLGSDSLTDLAVLAVDIQGISPIRLGSTDTMSVGDTAFAVGNPLTLEGGPSITSGVISAFNRRVLLPGGRELFGMLQTDAPITRGSSGGALVDQEGRLIGITTAVGISDLGTEGIGFAIPVELVERITTDIITDGFTTHAFLGVSGSTHLADNADGSMVPSGVEVAEAIEGTAAEAAGILAGDIIVSFDGIAITTMEQLVVRLRFTRVGDVVTIGVLRDGATIDLQVELLARPEGV